MNIQDWGAVAEIFGSLAVVLSLLYLAQQIKHGTAIDRLAAHERNSDLSISIREKMVFHPEVATLFLKGARHFDELHGVEKFRFDNLLRIFFSAYQAAFIRQQVLASDPLEFEGTAHQIDGLLQSPGIEQWYLKAELDWRPEFKTFVRARLDKVHASAS